MLFTGEGIVCQNSSSSFGTRSGCTNSMNSAQRSRHPVLRLSTGHSHHSYQLHPSCFTGGHVGSSRKRDQGERDEVPLVYRAITTLLLGASYVCKSLHNHAYRNKDGLQFKLVKHLTLQGWGDWLMGE